MQFDHNISKSWRITIEHALPELLEKVGLSNGRALVIGASVLQIYHDQKWITRARATGDLDLSVGLVSNSQEYYELRQSLIDKGYKASDKDRAFRLYSPVTPSLSCAYVDLLAHPEGPIPDKETRRAMGVGDSWSFKEILFALENAYTIATNVYVPNPIGFLALKRASYVDDPQRTRDLVDIVDLVYDLVNNALHFELRDTWEAMAAINPTEAAKVKACIQGIVTEAAEWDLGRAEQEFQTRGYNMDLLETDAPKIFGEFLGELESSS